MQQGVWTNRKHRQEINFMLALPFMEALEATEYSNVTFMEWTESLNTSVKLSWTRTRMEHPHFVPDIIGHNKLSETGVYNIEHSRSSVPVLQCCLPRRNISIERGRKPLNQWWNFVSNQEVHHGYIHKFVWTLFKSIS